MAESTTSSANSLPPPPQAPAAPGQQDYNGSSGTNGSGGGSHMPPPPLPPVVIPQAGNNPIPSAASPFTGNYSGNSAAAMGSPAGTPRRAAPEPNKRALYVGGLDPRVTEDVLRQIFETAGHVQNVKIIPDKNNKGYNYGFVEYDDPGAAERAMQNLSGRRVHNNEIKVNWAYQSSNTNKEDTSNHFHIFVGDLSNEVNDEVLYQAFAVFGTISEARVMWDMKTGRSRGYGFVAYRDRSDAEKALSSMDGEWLGSRAIRCNWANQKGQPSISQQTAMAAMGLSPATPYGHHQYPVNGVQSYEMILSQTPSWQTTCYVGNLTPYTTQNDLVPLFQNFGYVTETRLSADRGFAFVKMDTHENAAMAICQLSGYQVNGRPLKCSWGKDRPPTGQFDPYSPGQPGTPSFAQPSPGAFAFPQYAGGPLSPATGHPQAMAGYGPPHQSPAGAPGPGGRGFPPQTPQGGYPSAGFPPQGFGQMPGSAGGYGQEQGPPGGWNQPGTPGYGRGGPAGGPPNYGGY